MSVRYLAPDLAPARVWFNTVSDLSKNRLAEHSNQSVEKYVRLYQSFGGSAMILNKQLLFDKFLVTYSNRIVFFDVRDSVHHEFLHIGATVWGLPTIK